jgi:hypothetical protein
MGKTSLGMLIGAIVTLFAVELTIAFAPRFLTPQVCTFTVSDRAGHSHQFEGVR